MFCQRCGSEIKNDVSFCPRCGAKVSGTSGKAGGKAKTAKLPKGKIRFLIIGIIAAVAVASVSAIIIASVSSSKSNGGDTSKKEEFKELLDDYFDAIKNEDVDLMLNSVLADYWVESYSYDFDRSFTEEVIEEKLENLRDRFDHLGDNLTIKYKVTEKKRASKEELEDLKENIFDWYASEIYDDISELKITDACVINVEYTVTGDNGSEKYEFSNPKLIVKENGKWRLTLGYLSNSFYEN